MAGVTTMPTWSESSDSRWEAIPMSWSASAEPPFRFSSM